MLWVLKRTVSMRRLFWAPKTYVKTDMGKKIFTILGSKNLFKLWLFLNTHLSSPPSNFYDLLSRPRGRGFEPHRRHCVVVLEQDKFILA